MDPTWYGPKSIVLAAIEVNLATVCASVPVFWPMITQGLGKIFVTQEVHVVHQHRRLSGEERCQRGYGGGGVIAGSDICGEDDDHDHYELRVSESGTTSHSRGGSESSLTLVRSKTGGGATVLTKQQREVGAPPIPALVHSSHHHNQHYSDKYVASRVAPLGLHHHQSDISASNEIKSDGQKGFKKEQERFGSRNRNRSDGSSGSGGGIGGGGQYHPPKSIFED